MSSTCDEPCWPTVSFKGPHGAACVVQGCADAACPDRMDVICAEIARVGAWEPELLALAAMALQACPDGWFIDVGAHVGVYVTLALQLGHNPVLAFEPHPVHFAALESTCKLNGVDTEERVVAMRAKAGTSAGFVAVADCVPDGADVALIKVDIEGGEPGAVRSCRPLFEARRVRAVLVEVTPRYSCEYADMLTALLGFGFRLYDVGLGGLGSAEALTGNDVLATKRHNEITDVAAFLERVTADAIGQANVFGRLSA